MINNRKLDHIRICVEEDVEAGSTGLERYELRHNPLPELNYDDISLSTKLLGKKLGYPIIIEALTGGTQKSMKINKELAAVCQEYGIGFGVGSQRAAIEDPKLSKTFKVRDMAPDTLLIANLGAVQLNYGYGLKECQTAVDMIDADALALHVNPVQEAIQPEGNKYFTGLVEKINSVAEGVSVPVILKGVGSGVSRDVVEKLKVSAVDVGGVGGTSWSLVEKYRRRGKNAMLGETFAGWGTPTARCITDLTDLNIPLIASGGIRTGLDAAKAMALGASASGMALPIIRAWDKDGVKSVREYLDTFIDELHVALFLTGSKNIDELREKITE